MRQEMSGAGDDAFRDSFGNVVRSAADTSGPGLPKPSSPPWSGIAGT